MTSHPLHKPKTCIKKNHIFSTRYIERYILCESLKSVKYDVTSSAHAQNPKFDGGEERAAGVGHPGGCKQDGPRHRQDPNPSRFKGKPLYILYVKNIVNIVTSV